MENKAGTQPYDNLLKRLVEKQPQVVLPMLFPDLVREVTGEVNIEILLPPRRADRVYKILPVDSEEEEILHVEYEVSPTKETGPRVLVYHAVLYDKHQMPINSVLVYPFETSGCVHSPLLETRRNGKQILRLDYQTLELWKEDARPYVEQKLVPLYGLLPTMDGTSDDLLLRAVDEVIQYYQDNLELLRDELLCFRTMLNRAKRLPEDETIQVRRRIRMFDPLLEEDPWVKEKVAEGKLHSVRDLFLTYVKTHFPSLTTLAETKAQQTRQWDALNALFVQIMVAENEQTAREILDQFSAH